MRNKLFFIIGICLIAVLLTGIAGVAFAKNTGQAVSGTEQPPMRTMNVSGTGKAYLTPDIAYINIGVQTENKDASEAVSSNNTQTQKVTAALKAAGVDEKDIQTTNFSIYPQPKYDDKGQPTGEITYVVQNTVSVTVRDISKIGDILDAAVKAGANNIYGIQFDVSDKSEALTLAREEAVKNAQVAANDLAKASGVTLGPIQTISSYGGGAPVYLSEGKGGGMAVADAASVPVSAGQMVLTVDVNIVYEIR
jgi:uncharacterized protein